MVKPFRMLAELAVLALCWTWALGKRATRVVGNLLTGLPLLVVGLLLGLLRLVRTVTWCLPCLALRWAASLLYAVMLWLCSLLGWGLAYGLCLSIGFAVAHVVWLTFRGQSMAVVLRTLNMTLPKPGCPY